MGFKGEINYARQAISRTVPLKIYEVYLDTAPDWDGEGDEDQEVGAYSDHERAQSWILRTVKRILSPVLISWDSSFKGPSTHIRSAQEWYNWLGLG